jgi:hypothetical protein
MDITVVNKHHGQTGEYIGRGSPLGNPYSHLPNTKALFRVDTREQAISSYETWLDQQIKTENPDVVHELVRLYRKAETGPVKLVCYCAPKACHGDVIRRILLKEKEIQG